MEWKGHKIVSESCVRINLLEIPRLIQKETGVRARTFGAMRIYNMLKAKSLEFRLVSAVEIKSAPIPTGFCRNIVKRQWSRAKVRGSRSLGCEESASVREEEHRGGGGGAQGLPSVGGGRRSLLTLLSD
jgi:hypothetical protein